MNTNKYPSLREQAESNRDRPWHEAVPSPEWTQPDHYGIARPFQLIYEALIPLGFSIAYHKGISVSNIAHLWGIYKGDEKGYIVYNVEKNAYFVVGMSHPDPRPKIPDGVQWITQAQLWME